MGPGLIGRQVTSSAPRPDIIALMMAALDVKPGMTVCEIGTGTGYTAALLAERLGSDKVTTIEVDPQVAAQARLALAKTGYGDVKVITGDGAQGYPPRAPYDRVLATVAAPLVPYDWVSQTRPGGRVVTPWATRYYSAGLLSLTVGDDGTAVGGLVNNTVSFMWLRDQRAQRVGSVHEFVYDQEKAVERRADLHPADVLNDEDAAFTIGLQVPDCEYVYCPAGDGSGKYTVWFLDPVSRSWAAINYEPGVDTYHASQLGPRKLWDEVEAAYRWWVDAGSPKTGQWRFTVMREGQHIELAP
ncbi:MAG: methyltransferase domain-containing protein [Actinomycetota bacterium]|nr:methyltransferase domain-containing protein [Actinomycetota bacterium]